MTKMTKKRKRNFSSISFFSCSTFFVVVLNIFLFRSYLSPFFTRVKTNEVDSISSSQDQRSSEIPDIFELSLWRHILIGLRGNQSLCSVPAKYLSIANAFCHAQGREDCPQIPCTLIYLTDEFSNLTKCRRGGKKATNDEFDWICRTSPALELFSNTKRRPSIMAEAYTHITAELYGQALFPYHDSQTTKWGLTLEGESIGYYPSVAKNKRVLSLFDITIGYDRRYFDLITDVHLTDYRDQITTQRLTIAQLMEKKVKDHLPILWVNSNCETPSNRTNYVLELSRFIGVDALGRCGNKNWNKTLTGIDPSTLAKEKMTLTSEYLFTIAIENSLEYDYVTEKLWQPLAAGSIPLYLGAPNIDDWLPCENYSCIIHLRDFQSIEQLAKHLQELVNDREKYFSYHRWRNAKEIRPSFQKLINYFREANEHSIECLICDLIHRNDQGMTRRKLLAAKNPFDQPFPSLI